ncbi:MAG: ABC transporter ATP-binding protein [Candidatus Marinimicrobia bacterium]|jgi:ATP-binding cassette, subfamily B, bacterial MsbA|nr:ABC transporter ATP-binding protein [Candidatus Neomarinimicrobiota bacterium]MBT3632055.1 ABC transporter ATP-binding protein [Candidatus Neomarinimicrobiota bacterium]MBT3824641.1 ABC transporter ATP-binding protein [Candidatus Neomarinimicrobiota bacterium]MBT4130185.1 ABC transporter ATP-binding protein [Candidatus Neomarinimicrobiota bacterium]MBT4296935.1 ABC transporter ATP-binding protein [Candidatus Neomarinimicrobiota bacterium]
MYLRILKLIKPYWAQISVGIGFSFINVLFHSLTLWLSASFITTIFANPDEQLTTPAESLTGNIDLNERLKQLTSEYFFSGTPVDALATLALVILFSYFIKSIAYYGNKLFTGYVQAKVVQDLRLRLYQHFLTQPLSFFQTRRSGDLISLAMNDVLKVNQALATTFHPLVIEPLYIVTYLSILFIINWQLTLISILIIPITSLFIAVISKSIRRKVVRVQTQLGEITSRFTELISGIRIIKAFVNEDNESKRFGGEAQKLFKLMFRQIGLQSLSLPVTEMLGVSMAVVLLWVGGVQVLEHGTISSSDFLRFIVILFAIYQPIRNLAKVNISIQAGVAAGGRVFKILDIEPAIRDESDSKDLAAFEKEIRFESVTFVYDNSDMQAIKNLDTVIQKGEVVALVGPSGAGKTTVVDLIPRFHDINAGSISIDGSDIRNLTRASIRRQIGIVSQETILFNDTVYNNIAYGMPSNASDVEAAARQANAHDFILNLEEGYETMLGEHGARLSGGQKQRIAIARALLKDPSILILDEATSALDTESEKAVQSAIETLMKGRTVIVIAHRLSTILSADKILVMDQGEIVEQGNHAGLSKAGGLYEKLYRLQFAKGETV